MLWPHRTVGHSPGLNKETVFQPQREDYNTHQTTNTTHYITGWAIKTTIREMPPFAINNVQESAVYNNPNQPRVPTDPATYCDNQQPSGHIHNSMFACGSECTGCIYCLFIHVRALPLKRDAFESTIASHRI